MLGKLFLSGALLFAPVLDEAVTEPETPSVNENEGDKVEPPTKDEWENAKDTIIEWTKDTDGDGIPDKINEELSKLKNTELIGGVTIGAIASTFIAVLGVFISFRAYKKKFMSAINVGEKANAVSSETSAHIKKAMENLINEQAKIVKEIEEEFIRQFNAQNQKLEVYADEFKRLNTNLCDLNEKVYELSSELDNIKKSNQKVDVLLENQKEIAANNDNMVANGSAKALSDRVEALKNEEETN